MGLVTYTPIDKRSMFKLSFFRLSMRRFVFLPCQLKGARESAMNSENDFIPLRKCMATLRKSDSRKRVSHLGKLWSFPQASKLPQVSQSARRKGDIYIQYVSVTRALTCRKRDSTAYCSVALPPEWIPEQKQRLLVQNPAHYLGIPAEFVLSTTLESL